MSSKSIPSKSSFSIHINDRLFNLSCSMVLLSSFLILANLENERSPLQLVIINDKNILSEMETLGHSQYKFQNYLRSVWFDPVTQIHRPL